MAPGRQGPQIRREPSSRIRLRIVPTQYPMCNCYGLERFAMLRYDIDDIRKLEAASVP
jgi:hypothetical protein